MQIILKYLEMMIFTERGVESRDFITFAASSYHIIINPNMPKSFLVKLADF